MKSGTDEPVVQVKLREWSCDNCRSVFYTYERDGALCPECGVPAVRCGELALIVRDRALEKLMEDVVEQKCSESCWVYQDGMTAANIERIEALVGECTVARLRRALYGNGCPVKDLAG